MSYLLPTVTIVGLSGMVTQVLLLRELLVSFNGNELTLGIILANWLISEALGAFIAGKLIDRARNKINVFLILQIAFSLLLPASVYLSRIFKAALGIPFAESIGIGTIFYSSLIIILPVSLCHGALFSACCKLYSSIGRVYTAETIGAIIGGVALTYVFIPYLDSFQIAFIVSLLNVVVCLFFSRYISSIKLKYGIFALFILANYLFLSGAPDYMHRLSINKQYGAGKVLDYRNSVYGNIAVTKREEQYTFFYNGIPIVTTPYPDITFVEEFGNLPLLFHSAPKDILIISGGAGGILNEVLKHPVERIDYAELDPLIIKMLKIYPSQLTEREISDKRVNIINTDGRFLLRTSTDRYDIVLIGVSSPLELSINRLFTKEAFSLVKKRLKPEGIIAIWLPGSLTYLSRDLRDLNACIINALKNVYTNIRIIPGDYNILLASDSDNILKVTPELIMQRLTTQNIKTNLLNPSYLEYRLNRKWLEWFMSSSIAATKRVNYDLAPFAVFEMLIFWNKQFYPQFTHFFESLQNLNLRSIFIFIVILTLILAYLFKKKSRTAGLSISYSIATTGFVGMLVNLILIFSFQIFYGYLYHNIGMLISIFMAGIAAGSIYITRKTPIIKNAYRLFIYLEAAIVIFLYLLAFTILRFSDYIQRSPLLFIILFFSAGLLIGLEFPLASSIYLRRDDKKIGQTAGLLYFCDLIGGWLAGMIGSILFLPILGLLNTCLIMIIFKLSSIFLLISAKTKSAPITS